MALAAALTALRAIENPLLVILGGYNKGSDLRPVAEEAARRAKFTACIGATGPGLVADVLHEIEVGAHPGRSRGGVVRGGRGTSTGVRSL